MAWFRNKAEWREYRKRWCARCQHGETADTYSAGCEVWKAHRFYADGWDMCARAVLDWIIPRSADGKSNGQCTMFLPRAEA